MILFSVFPEQFEDTSCDVFKPETEYKILDEWASIMALSIIAMVDEEYGVSIDGNDIRDTKTIQDLFNVVESRKNDI